MVKLFRLPSGLYNAEAEREDNYIGRQIARLRRKKGMSLAGLGEELCRRGVDVGLLGMECEKDSMTCEPFCEDRMVLITPVSDRFLKMQMQGVPAAELLTQEPVILREKGSGSKKSVERFMEQYGIQEEKLNVTARINDPEAIKNLVAGGFGVSIVSSRVAWNFVREKRLLEFGLPGSAGVRSLCVAYRADRAEDARVKEFANFLVGRYEHNMML